MGKKVLIVGSNGFAGAYLRKELLDNGFDVWGADIASSDERTFAVNMLDANAASAVIQNVKPDCIYNLAGMASPQLSWERPVDAMHLNVDISVNIMEAARNACPGARIIMIGSSNQYDVERCTAQTLTENTPQRASSPYVVSKIAQEGLIKLLADRYGMDLIITRSFNHIGPGQKVGFVVTDFASRIVAVERGETDLLKVGSLNEWRDFSDVRDTVRAYRLLFEKGRAGEIYNVGSGKSYQIGWILDTLLSFSSATPTIISKSNGKKGSELICDCTKIFNDTGYKPNIPIETSLRDVLEYFRQSKQ